MPLYSKVLPKNSQQWHVCCLGRSPSEPKFHEINFQTSFVASAVDVGI